MNPSVSAIRTKLYSTRLEELRPNLIRNDRDVRLDLLRGYAMLAIAVNHLTQQLIEFGLAGPRIPTLASWGFSSAAEIFFLLSGYMVGLVYVKSPQLTKRLLGRAWTIYKVNLLVFAVVIVISAFGSSSLAALTRTDYTLDNPTRAALEFMIFQQHPMYLDVLMFYVFFMIVAPLVIKLMKANTAVFILVSCALYLAAQIDGRLNLPVHFHGDGEWGFNPFAWQLLFFGGVLAGSRRLYERLPSWGSSPLVVTLLAAAFLASFVLKTAHDRYGLVLVPPVLIDKQNLGILRLLHTLVVVGLLTYLVEAARPYLNSWPAKLVALVGRHTLHCFGVSVVATYALAAIWLQFWPSHPAYLLFATMILAIVCLTAWFQEHRKHAQSGLRPT